MFKCFCYTPVTCLSYEKWDYEDMNVLKEGLDFVSWDLGCCSTLLFYVHHVFMTGHAYLFPLIFLFIPLFTQLLYQDLKIITHILQTITVKSTSAINVNFNPVYPQTLMQLASHLLPKIESSKFVEYGHLRRSSGLHVGSLGNRGFLGKKCTIYDSLGKYLSTVS